MHNQRQGIEIRYVKERADEAQQALTDFRIGAKRLNAQLKMIVNSGDSCHHLLEARQS